ncbi:metal ABC transporter substrate-binding protein [Bacteriovorax sp. Seq25_V]|uniref:metal ABC transporter substrate-binding protein n=1 Tax=Bacteriovorax sp. Seq25_V TaxID=1201288 RepID=UPI000389F4DE|nr:metal ABC transporter substrate-binding protein [Bacteriovorax sp. Seq25_V]EQC46848.1 periplasmic solute-binding family protein [Bacteriovorax sp. Seq25_V]
MNKFLIALLVSIATFGDGRIITTTNNAASIVKLLVGDKASVESLTLGPQDPHYLSSKPSFTVKLSRADLLISIGMELEEGWLPLVTKGARNPKILHGAKGSLVLGEYLKNPLEVPVNLSRAQGDVHAAGNPHFLLSPQRVLELLPVISTKLVETFPDLKEVVRVNRAKLETELQNIVREMKSVKFHKNIIMYHKTLSYFLNDMGIEVAGYLEPKPGIPPSAAHMLNIMKTIDEKNVKLVLVENYFSDSIARKLQEKKDVRIYHIPVAAEGVEKVTTIVDLYRYLLNIVRVEEGK